MGATSLILIFALEALVLCLAVVFILATKNRRLRQNLRKLQAIDRDASASPAAELPNAETYSDQLLRQIELTKEYHYRQGSRSDIALDLDPDAPLPRRTAALRHAFLIAEKEACRDDAIAWNLLSSRYLQLLSYHQDYTAPTDSGMEEELAQIKQELVQAQKRINNLERFKVLYFELEERWEKCKDKASVHYTELRSLAEKSEQKEDFERLLAQYQESYWELGALIDQGVSDNIQTTEGEEEVAQHLQEIRRLRGVAADQHRIITQLQGKLSATSAPEEREHIVGQLQNEIQKQARFLQESETCIKLMEDELATAKRESEQLRRRLEQLPELKGALKTLQKASITHEQIVESLKQENRRLAKKLKLTQETPPEDNQEARTLRKELSTLQAKYNDLEEKFLDLKLKN